MNSAVEYGQQKDYYHILTQTRRQLESDILDKTWDQVRDPVTDQVRTKVMDQIIFKIIGELL